MKKVKIMRGLPGSGKSTKAKEYGGVVVSADDFFMVNGEYQFDVGKIGKAHGQCRKKFEEAVMGGEPVVVVDNTNTQIWEFATYEDLAKSFGYEVEVVHVESGLTDEELFERGTHNVPLETIKKMRERWES